MASQKTFDIRPPSLIKQPSLIGQKTKSKKILKHRKPIKKSVAKESKGRRPSFSKKFLVFIPVVLGSLFLFLHFSAKADVRIWPKGEIFSFEEKIVVDTQALKSDFSEGIIPGHVISGEKDVSKTFLATGTKAEESKATGRIKVFNNYDVRQVLVVRTRFLSAEGKLFYLTEGVSIPSKDSLEVTVEAAESGPEYNIKPTTFSVPGLLGSPRYTFVYAESYVLIEGGSEESVSLVSQKDLERAEERLVNDLSTLLEQEFENMTGTPSIFIKDSIQSEILRKSHSSEEGSKAKSFDFYLKLSSKTIAFKQEELESLVKYFISERISLDESIIKEGSLEIIPSVEKIDPDNIKLFLNIKISAEIFKKIDVDSLKKALSGKTLKENEAYLSFYPEIEKAEFKIFPFWVQKIPENLGRISIEIDLEK